MPIVSISLDDESVSTLDTITETLKLKGRSEAVRFALKTAMAEIKETDEFVDHTEGVMILVHDTHGDRWVSIIQHKYENIIKTQLHSHLRNRMCLELMIISGNGDDVKAMIHEIHSIGSCEYLKFVRS